MTPTLLWKSRKNIEGYFSETNKSQVKDTTLSNAPSIFSSFLCVRLFCTRIRAKEHEKEKIKKR